MTLIAVASFSGSPGVTTAVMPVTVPMMTFALPAAGWPVLALESWLAECPGRTATRAPGCRSGG